MHYIVTSRKLTWILRATALSQVEIIVTVGAIKLTIYVRLTRNDGTFKSCVYVPKPKL